MGNYFFNIIAKRSKIITALALLLGFGLVGCNDIFEKDISGQKPVLIIPMESDSVYSNNVHFKWQELEGASFYNLQIVKPGFDDIDFYMLDSNVAATEFHQILDPGEYAYRLRAENGAYKSDYAGPYTFYVDSVNDLSAQYVSLVAPANNIYINGSSEVVLSWLNLYAANNYDYVLKIGDSFETGSILDQQFNLSELDYTILADQFSLEGEYFWGVRASNDFSVSPFSSRKINVDLTAPNSPELTTPLDEEIFLLTDEVVLKWTKGIDPGSVNSPVTSTVEIATTESFIDAEVFPGLTVDTLAHTFDATGTYYWRVKTEDQAGNVSEYYSFEREIIIE